ncbi:c-type cytochrome [Ectothiorhodospiraceae bacterium WFHF3C12]|nr:c-type cytochrome [Ectothiorhodospiraceae bacterium WFHF3C12]
MRAENEKKSIGNTPIAVILVVGAYCLLFASMAGAEAPEVAKPCVQCHGETGNSDEAEIPRVAGASAFFLENQLLVFGEEARPCAKEEFDEAEEKPPAGDHCALARDLSDEEIAELAEYFSSQEFVPVDQPVDAQLAELGAKIHDQRCDKCHSEGGSLALDDAGILAGQSKAYLMEQLQDYKAGERWQPEKMQPQMEELSEEDMKALVEYYASQGQKRF